MLLLFYILLIPALLIFCVSLYNYLTKPVISKFEYSASELVSVLIPARNEEKNIAKCIKQVICQTYSNIEIIIYNDNSEDRTRDEILSVNDSRIIMIDGKELPKGWTGKNHACHILSKSAKGDYFLFIDADVILRPDTISSALYYSINNALSLLSVFPTQVMVNKSEYLITPLMNWFLLSFLPLMQVFKSDKVSLTAANGQFMFWKKADYNRIGGHDQYKNQVVEDMEMAKGAKQSGMKVMTLLGGDLIFCRMYEGLKSGIDGFGKNFFTGTNMTPVSFAVFILYIFILYNFSFLLFFIYPQFLIIFIMLSIGRGMISAVSGQNIPINFILTPLQICIMLYTGIRSAFFRKEISWKNRPLN